MKIKPDKLICLIFTLVGGIFLIIGICLLVGKNQQAKDQIPVQATVMEINTHRRGNKKWRQTVVEYEVDGKRYTQALGYYDSRLREGDALEVLVNRNNPSQATIGISILEPIFIGIGGLFVVLGIGIRALLRKLLPEEKESPYLL